MTDIKCFFLEPTEKRALYLRRYAGSSTCPEHGYHNAKVLILKDYPKDSPSTSILTAEQKADPLWPKACDCGYVFQETDMWQHFGQEIYRRTDTGEELPLLEAPPGSMYYADWMLCGSEKPGALFCGPDGHCLIVQVPGGQWVVDGPASNGPKNKPGWTRSGTPPNVTASPSIGIGEHYEVYHGWLRDGILSSC